MTVQFATGVVLAILQNSTTFNDLDWLLTGISRSQYFSTLNISETTRDKARINIEHQ